VDKINIGSVIFRVENSFKGKSTTLHASTIFLAPKSLSYLI